MIQRTLEPVQAFLVIGNAKLVGQEHLGRAWGPKRKKDPRFEDESLRQCFYTLWAASGRSGCKTRQPGPGSLPAILVSDISFKL
ncbi:hypothetical protein AO353_09340 [Pseudomonas fluorescens]|uniref:Uncharacterized protein n=1 Tax=Pseudomonas fluorescens TaxID=294 RepID=A0A0N9WTK1_PSEFL|nr:hypothetical protein AO353_09340 [Pseudomonas fluorescens]